MKIALYYSEKNKELKSQMRQLIQQEYPNEEIFEIKVTQENSCGQRYNIVYVDEWVDNFLISEICIPSACLFPAKAYKIIIRKNVIAIDDLKYESYVDPEKRVDDWIKKNEVI